MRRRSGRAAIEVLCGGVALLATVLAVCAQLAARDAATGWVTHTERVLAALDQAELSIADMEAGERRYVRTRGPDALMAYGAAGQHLDAALRWLRDSTADNPAQRQRVDSVAGLTRAGGAHSAGAVALAAAGAVDHAAAPGRAVDPPRRGDELLAEARDLLTRARAGERHLLAARRAVADAAAVQLRFQVGLLVVVCATVAGATIFAMRRDARALARSTDEAHAAAAAAREAVERARQLFEGSPSVQLLLDAESGDVVGVNPAAEAFYGWSGELMRRMRVGHVAGVSPDEFRDLTAELRAGGPRVARQRHRQRSGELRDVEAFLSPLTVDGRALVHASVHDVTARVQAEAALRTSEARFRAALDGSVDPFYLLTPVRAGDAPGAPVTDFTFTEVNARGAALFGTFPDDLAGTRMCEALPLARETGVFARCAEVLADGEPAEFEHATRDPRTTARWLWMQVTPVRAPDCTITAVALTARDISEAKAAQVRIRDSEARYRTLFEQSPGPAWVYDVETLRFVAVNPAAERLYGWRADEFLALSLPDLHADLDRATVAAQARAAGDRTLAGVARQHRTRDGRTLDVVVSTARVDYSGRRARLALVEDVTDRVRAESERTLVDRVARALSDAPNTEAAFVAALEALCEASGWACGEVWHADVASGTLTRGPVWCRPGRPELRAFADASAAFCFRPGEGLPGRAHGATGPVWVQDLEASEGYARRALAAAAGLRSGGAVPLVADGEVVAVLAFHATTAGAGDERHLAQLAAVAAQVGAVVRRKRAEDDARESERRFRGVLENLSASAITVDGDGRVTFVNDAFLALTGWAREEVLGQDYFARFIPEGHEIAQLFRDAMRAGQVGDLPAHYENEILTRAGERRLVAWDNVVLRDRDGCPTGTASVGQDVTVQRAYEARLTALSEHDELTGLYNRRGFRRMAEHEARVVARMQRRDAVLYIDLDRFKPINDTFGHQEGDAALRAVAALLRATVRDADFAARLGGDEFAVYAVGLRNAGEGQVLADRLRAVLDAHNAHATAAGRPYEIGFTVGVSEIGPGDDVDAALARADAALYAAKSGRGHPGRGYADPASLVAWTLPPSSPRIPPPPSPPCSVPES